MEGLGIRGLERWLQRAVADGEMAGGVFGIVDRTGDVRILPFGVVDTVDGTGPAHEAHRFLLTSVSKTFTGLQVLTLVEDGALTLDTPIADLVPPFADNGKDDVRVWHVLTHTSGLDDTDCNTAEGPAAGLDAADHLAAVLAAPLAAPPGARVAYCSPPFWVLAEIVRVVTGRAWPDHLRDVLLGPTGMTSTGYAAGEPPPDYVAARIGNPQHAHLPEQVRRCAYPAGGIVGTAGDLLRYGHMLLDGGVATGGRVLAPRTVAMLHEPWTVGLPGARDYEGGSWRTERGLGWALGGPGDLRSPRTLWHSGGSGTSMWVDPDAGLALVLLTATWFLPRALLGRVVNVAMASVSASPPRR